MTEAPSPTLASWKEALIRWQDDAFSKLELPSVSERATLLKDWSFNYPFQLMRAALDGVDVHGPSRDMPTAALDKVHASAQTALVRLAHQVPAADMSAILVRVEALWGRARGVVHDTLSAPRVGPKDPDATAQPLPLPGFEAAWPEELPRPIHRVLADVSLGARLGARRQGQEAAVPSSQPPVRSGLRA